MEPTTIKLDYPEGMSDAEKQALDDQLNALFEHRPISTGAMVWANDGNYPRCDFYLSQSACLLHQLAATAKSTVSVIQVTPGRVPSKCS